MLSVISLSFRCASQVNSPEFSVKRKTDSEESRELEGDDDLDIMLMLMMLQWCCRCFWSMNRPLNSTGAEILNSPPPSRPVWPLSTVVMIAGEFYSTVSGVKIKHKTFYTQNKNLCCTDRLQSLDLTATLTCFTPPLSCPHQTTLIPLKFPVESDSCFPCGQFDSSQQELITLMRLSSEWWY